MPNCHKALKAKGVLGFQLDPDAKEFIDEDLPVPQPVPHCLSRKLNENLCSPLWPC